MPISSTLKLIILDFDGTTARTHDDIIHCMERTFDFFVQPLPSRDVLLKTIGLTLEDSFRLLVPDISEKDLIAWGFKYRLFYDQNGGKSSALFEGIKEALEELQSRKIDVLIVSNKGTVALKAALEKFGISKYIRHVLGGDVTKYKKPNPDLYYKEIKALYPNILPTEVLVVGDTHVDLEFAKNAKLKACWASYGYGDAEKCKTFSPAVTLKSARELSEAILVF